MALWLDEIDIVFQKSEEALKAAMSNIENQFYSTSINRFYYVVFYAAKVLLLKKVKNPKTHGSNGYSQEKLIILRFNYSKIKN